MPWEDNLDFINKIEDPEKYGPQDWPELQKIADVLRELLDRAATMSRRSAPASCRRSTKPISRTSGNARSGPLPRSIGFFGKRPIEGPKSFLKKRKM